MLLSTLDDAPLDGDFPSQTLPVQRPPPCPDAHAAQPALLSTTPPRIYALRACMLRSHDARTRPGQSRMRWCGGGHTGREEGVLARWLEGRPDPLLISPLAAVKRSTPNPPSPTSGKAWMGFCSIVGSSWCGRLQRRPKTPRIAPISFRVYPIRSLTSRYHPSAVF